MFVKLFIKGLKNSQPTMEVKENHKIIDLKIELEKHAKIPSVRQKIVFCNKVLGDEYRLCKVFRESSAELLVFDNENLFCHVRCPDESKNGFLEMNDGNMKMPQDLQSKIFGLAGSCSSEGSSDPSATSCCPVSRSLANAYKDECKIECCDEGGSDRPPYTKVMPEDRRFGVVIVNEECPDSCDFTCILMFLAEAFHEAEDAETLNFSDCTPAVVFDCSLLIVAADSDTSDWILKAARPMSPTYSANPFIKHFQLVRCTFVIPMIVEEPLCKVFYIIEKQNAGLNTGKWCVMKKAKLDPCSLDYPSKAIYQSGDNYELVVYICLDSKCYIENHCARIRYMLWNLPVEFIQGFKCS